MDLSELTRLKKACKEITEKRIRAEGLQEEALKRIRELGYDTVEDAEKELKKLEKEQAKKETEIENMIEELQEEFPDL